MARRAGTTYAIPSQAGQWLTSTAPGIARRQEELLLHPFLCGIGLIYCLACASARGEVFALAHLQVPKSAPREVLLA